MTDREDSVSMTCLNTSSGEIVWELAGFDPDGWSNTQGPELDNGLLYVAGRHTVHCINASTGEALWKHEDASFGSLHTADIVFDDNNLFFKSGFGYVKCLDKLTGNVVWENRDTKSAGVSSMRMTQYEGKLIYSDTRLIILDAQTGENIAMVWSPNESREYPSTRFSHITIDRATGLAYAGDGYFMMCFELP